MMIPKTPEQDAFDVERMVADIREKVRQRAQTVAAQNVPRESEAATEFVEDEYLALYPDVAASVAAGSLQSGHDHWLRIGRAEGRLTGRPGKSLRAAIQNAGGLTGQELLRRVHLATARVEMQIVSIGLPPPGPKTLRSRISASFMRPIAKLLWWYTHSIRESAKLANARNREVNNLLQSLVEAQDRANETVRSLSRSRDES